MLRDVHVENEHSCWRGATCLIQPTRRQMCQGCTPAGQRREFELKESAGAVAGRGCRDVGRGPNCLQTFAVTLSRPTLAHFGRRPPVRRTAHFYAHIVRVDIAATQRLSRLSSLDPRRPLP